MDPISAFALACNILQIIDTSAKVLFKASECYKDGTTAETSQLSGNLHLLGSLGSELRSIGAGTSSPLSTAEVKLVEANERCLQLSEQLGNLLNGLKINETSVWQALSRSVRTMRYRDKIFELREGVSDSRANLNLAMLRLMQ
ncbi:hypothetical protein PG993_012593 [Apiospora rasikravindrae]|uniref:Fungal N-terminal domain-containing protein n=1 Tax=Apiospora rasikravindrae TaxID=990691 RepID=A0ABR1S2W9_9PEZI